MKKTVFCLSLIMACLMLPSCAHADIFSDEHETESFELKENEKSRTDIPFSEGYYIGNDYVLEIVFTGNSAENSYNMMLFRKDTGATVFTGSAFDVKADGTDFSAPASNNTGMTLSASKLSNESIAVRMTYNDKKVPFVSGEYTLSKTGFTPDTRINGESLSDGSYTSENGVFSLNIYRDGPNLDFSITDTFNNEQVFLGVLAAGAHREAPVKSAVLLNTIKDEGAQQPNNDDDSAGSEKVELTKSIVNGVMCVDVTEHSKGKKDGYFGRYYYDDPEYLKNGEYECGDRIVKLSRSTVKGKKSSDGGFRYTEKITLTDENGAVMFEGTKELFENEEINCAVFGTKGKKLIFFKGNNENGEYVEVLNCGYIDGISINNRYSLQTAN